MPHSLPWYPCQHHDIFFTNTSFKYPHINSWLCHIHFKVLQYCIQEPRSWFSCFWKFCSSWLLQLCHQVYWPWVLNKWNAFFSKLIVWKSLQRNFEYFTASACCNSQLFSLKNWGEYWKGCLKDSKNLSRTKMQWELQMNQKQRWGLGWGWGWGWGGWGGWERAGRKG